MEEDNQFLSEFGELFPDGDDHIEVDSSNERRNDDEDSVEKYEGEAKVKTSKAKGRYFIKNTGPFLTFMSYSL